MTLSRLFVTILVMSILVPAVMAQDEPVPSSWIVFEASRGDGVDMDIYRMSPDGSSVQQLTSGPAEDRNAVWSPDGEWIVFESGGYEGKSLYRMRADGSEQQWLAELAGAPSGGEMGCFLNEAAWSPDGEWIVFEVCVNDTTDLYRIHPDGTDLQHLTDSLGSEANAAWSPDGEWIVFESWGSEGLDIYRMRTDGSEQQRLTDDPEKDWMAAWSPDSQWIVFVSDRDGIGQVYRMRADGSEQQQLVDTLENTNPMWSPDGEWIMFSSYIGNLYRMRADGSDLLNLNSPGLVRNAAWSPDGAWIVFDVKLEDGSMDLYRVRVNGIEQWRLTTDPGVDQNPEWSPWDELD